MTFIKGQPSWNKGIPQSKETKEKNIQSHLGKTPWNKGKKGVQVAWNKGLPNTWSIPPKPMFGENNPAWKGDKVGYRALHHWIESKLGNPNICANCGDINSNDYEWANIPHTYKRNLTDWARLCTLCHRRYDRGIIILSVI